MQLMPLRAAIPPKSTGDRKAIRPIATREALGDPLASATHSVGMRVRWATRSALRSIHFRSSRSGSLGSAAAEIAGAHRRIRTARPLVRSHNAGLDPSPEILVF